MAKKKITLESLAQEMKKGFSLVNQNIERGFAAVAEDIAELRTESRGDVISLMEKLISIEAEIRDIKRKLDSLEEQAQGMKGYAKEIDELRDRIREIERHIGLKKKALA
ncbi:hypothetical protein HY968_01595 [Candidatus Kaiserbacteria bacterium]|nr:hypothetical protein [Candidatus Kaiserbacteria bacterium]